MARGVRARPRQQGSYNKMGENAAAVRAIAEYATKAGLKPTSSSREAVDRSGLAGKLVIER